MEERGTLEACVARLGGLTAVSGKTLVPLREDELEAIEREFGAKLPDDYRKFLATYGASTFNYLTSIRAAGLLSPALSDDGLLPFGTFYGTNRAVHDFPSLRFCAEQLAGVIPGGLLPIADSGGDDQICIGLVGERERKERKEERKEDAARFSCSENRAASSFLSSFLSGCLPRMPMAATTARRKTSAR